MKRIKRFALILAALLILAMPALAKTVEAGEKEPYQIIIDDQIDLLTKRLEKIEDQNNR